MSEPQKETGLKRLVSDINGGIDALDKKGFDKLHVICFFFAVVTLTVWQWLVAYHEYIYIGVLGAYVLAIFRIKQLRSDYDALKSSTPNAAPHAG